MLSVRSGADKRSFRRSSVKCSLQEDRGEEGVDLGEEGGVEEREEQWRGLGDLKSSLTILSLKRLIMDLDEGGSASGCDLPSTCGSGKKQ